MLAALTRAQSDVYFIDGLLDKEGVIWNRTTDEFMAEERSHGFEWLTKSNPSAARSIKPGLKFFGLPVVEAVARFEGERVNEFVLSLYNRGDAGPMEEVEFLKLVNSLTESLRVWAGSAPVVFKDEERTTAVAVKRRAWANPPYRVDVTWSFTAKSRALNTAAVRPEYLRVQISRLSPANDPRKSAVITLGAKANVLTILELRAHVKREASGDVWINGVPMVDQGEKGYCAVAVAERVLRYYGDNVDQHEIAQLAGSSAASGTTHSAMLAALRRIGSDRHTEVTVHQEFGLGDFQSLVREYNSLAKRAGKSQITYGDEIDLLETIGEMDNSLYGQARARRDAGLAAFKTTVTKYCNNGVPLVWAVVIGKVEERPRLRGHGGHLRLIIGFNDRTKEILYSDTWGAGHELKRMALADAWAITLGLYSIEPRNVRF